MRSETAQPCKGPAWSVRSTRRSSVPCSRFMLSTLDNMMGQLVSNVNNKKGRPQTTMACPTDCYRLFRCGGFVRILRGLDVALEEVLVVLFAGVFHDLPVGPQRER